MAGSSFFQRLKQGLSKSRENLFQNLGSIFQNGRWDEKSLDAMEESLIAADVGVKASQKLVETLRRLWPVNEVDTEQDMASYLKTALIQILQGREARSAIPKRREKGLTRGRRHISRRSDRTTRYLGAARRRRGRQTPSGR
jgi:signal recognition particle GTPase